MFFAKKHQIIYEKRNKLRNHLIQAINYFTLCHYKGKCSFLLKRLTNFS